LTTLSRRSLVFAAVLAAPVGSLGAARANRAAAQDDAGPIRVTATVGMIGDLVANIGGDRVEVVSLMGPGVDPHLYKPSAGDVGRLEEADIIFYGGLELEGRMTDTFVRVARSGKPTIPVTETIPEESLREPAEFQGKYDPHIWFDVSLWMLAAQTVKDQLAAFAPEHEAEFQTNLDAYLAELETLDAYVQERIASIPEDRRVLITAHDAFGYFGDRYGLEVLGLQGVSTATEASASGIQDLADVIVERGIPAIFVESSVPPATIEALQAAARSRGAEVVIGGQLFSDAMGEVGTPEGTYIGMVRHNTDAIAAGLGGAVPATPAA
jgi:manganese/zinc/iron transport system substrate-binding protein